MTTATSSSFLLIGESDVGKTHYGAQLLRRLNSDKSLMSLEDGNNLEPFTKTMERISQGLSGEHTPRSESSISKWAVRRKSDGIRFELNWPDYGGEQINSMINERRMPKVWHDRIYAASAWAFMIRPNQIRLPEDVMTRHSRLPPESKNEDTSLPPQARLLEVLQMMKYKLSAYTESWSTPPPLCVLLSCYDELKTELTPHEYCKRYIPLLASFLDTNWPRSRLKYFGVSPLGQALNETTPDESYVETGPENKGYVVEEDGKQYDDLLLPINWMLDTSIGK